MGAECGIGTCNLRGERSIAGNSQGREGIALDNVLHRASNAVCIPHRQLRQPGDPDGPPNLSGDGTCNGSPSRPTRSPSTPTTSPRSRRRRPRLHPIPAFRAGAFVHHLEPAQEAQRVFDSPAPKGPAGPLGRPGAAAAAAQRDGVGDLMGGPHAHCRWLWRRAGRSRLSSCL